MKVKLDFLEILGNLKDYGIDSCWPWPHLDARGYGRLGGKLAHRLSFQHFNRNMNNSLHVCHSCDNPSCVNPSHLWQGTDKDNMDDMRKKNRQRFVGSSKLDSYQLQELKKEFNSLPARRMGRESFYKNLSIKYGVCWQHVRALATEKSKRLMDVK